MNEEEVIKQLAKDIWNIESKLKRNELDEDKAEKALMPLMIASMLIGMDRVEDEIFLLIEKEKANDGEHKEYS